MFSLGGLILDQNDDHGAEVFQDASLCKTASTMDLEVSTPDELEKLGDEKFAIVFTGVDGQRTRKYPLERAGDAWLSSQYLQKNAHKLPASAIVVAGTNIQAALHYHGLEQEKVAFVTNTYRITDEDTPVDTMEKAASAFEALPDECFALTTDQGNAFPLINPMMVKSAADWFYLNHRQLGPEQRVEFALRLEKKASEFGTALRQEIVQYLPGELRTDFFNAINKRMGMSKTAQQRFAYQTLLDNVHVAPPTEIAKALYEIDKMAGLDGHYDHQINDAFKSTFSERKLQKTAEFDVDGEDFTADEVTTALESDQLPLLVGQMMADKMRSADPDELQQYINELSGMHLDMFKMLARSGGSVVPSGKAPFELEY